MNEPLVRTAKEYRSGGGRDLLEERKKIFPHERLSARERDVTAHGGMFSRRGAPFREQ